MKHPFLFCCSLLLALAGSAQDVRPVGINLAGITDYSPEFVFVDAFKQSRAWIPFDALPDPAWDSGVPVPLGADGYPLEIPYDDGVHPPQRVRTLLFCGDQVDRFPGGQYRLRASGTGQLRLWGSASGMYTCPVDTLVLVDNSETCIFLELEASSAADPVRDIRFVMPGFHDSYETDPFYPALLDFVDDFSVIRFMDWMHTNNSPVVRWGDRNSLTYYTQTLARGVAYEHLIDLCNRTGKDAWVCVPHRADDAYITALAALLRDGLDPERRVYIEYSNEVWNGLFGQHAYADSMGHALGYPGEPWERAWQYTAKRSADVFRLFGTEFAGTPDRLQRVLPSWVNAWVTNEIITYFNDPTYNPTGETADMVAIAPYFGDAVGQQLEAAGLVDQLTVDDVLDSVAAALPLDLMYAQQCKEVADQHGLPLVAYEGGQHLTGGLFNDVPTLTDLLTAANRHPRMGELYCDYLDTWYDAIGGGLFALFSSHTDYNQYGSWGLKEHYADTLSPKYLAVQDCAVAYNVPPTATRPDPASGEPSIAVFPQPARGRLHIMHNLRRPQVQLFDPLGRALPVRVVPETGSQLRLDVENSYRGSAVLRLYNAEQSMSRVVILE